VENFVILPGDRVAVARLHLDVLPVGVMIARVFEEFFSGGKARDDFLRRGACGRGVLERTFLGEHRHCDCRARKKGEEEQTTATSQLHIYLSLPEFLCGDVACNVSWVRRHGRQTDRGDPPPTPLRSVRPGAGRCSSATYLDAVARKGLPGRHAPSPSCPLAI